MAKEKLWLCCMAQECTEGTADNPPRPLKCFHSVPHLRDTDCISACTWNCTAAEARSSFVMCRPAGEGR